MNAADIAIAGATVTGRAHQLAGRNGQDAFGWLRTPAGLVALVCDGCSSGTHSEVGAKVGCRILLRALAAELGPLGIDPAGLERARQAALAQLARLAESLGGGAAGVEEHLLFTVVGAAAGESFTTLFTIGDGLFAIDEDLIQVGPFPGNAPPYLGHALMGAPSPHFDTRASLPSGGWRTLLLATDGASDLRQHSERRVPGREEPVGPISQFWKDPRYFANPDALRRRLWLLSRDATRTTAAGLVKEPGLLSDDTTLVVLRKRAAEEAPWTSASMASA
jgi:hypothetical protein